MRRAMLAILLLGIQPPVAAAQAAAKPRPEIGFRGGYVLYQENGEEVSVLSLPGASLLDVATVYAMVFASDRVALEPQVGILRIGTESGGNGAIAAALQVNQFVRSATDDAPFIFINGGLTSGFGDGDGETFFSAGAGLGYRFIVRETLGVRFEGRYRRHFGDEAFATNEFGLLIGLGAVLGRNGQQ